MAMRLTKIVVVHVQKGAARILRVKSPQIAMVVSHALTRSVEQTVKRRPLPARLANPSDFSSRIQRTDFIMLQVPTMSTSTHSFFFFSPLELDQLIACASFSVWGVGR
jgi:hypothetical protein